ncbi:MAG: septal ring lytic transglycosylase RlpA family protein [Steroidobacteraceae bacterium]
MMILARRRGAVGRGLHAPIAILLVAALASACAPLRERGTTRQPTVERGESTGGSAAPPDVAAIPDAVPKSEPRSKFGNPASYEVFGRRYYVLDTAAGHVERGIASWYGPGFHAQRTSSGEPYDMYGMTAAHKTLPIPCYARITNLENNRSVVVRINDRGPFVGDRIVDLSYTAAAKLDMLRRGTALVELRVLQAGNATGSTIAAAIPVAASNAGAGPVAPPPAAIDTQAAAVTPSRPQSPSPSPSVVESAEPESFAQVGAYSDPANAIAMRDRLVGAGIAKVQLQLADEATGDRLHRVKVGPLASDAEFTALAQRLDALGLPAPLRIETAAGKAAIK